MAALRPSIADHINRISYMDDDELFEMMAELNELVDESIGIRYASKKTQILQDRHLELYETFVKFVKRTEAELGSDELKRIAFPDDFTDLYRQLRVFLVFVYTRSHPRSRASPRKHMSYGNLCTYRKSMLFWCKRVYTERSADPKVPPSGKIFNEMTESMRLVQMKFKDPRTTNLKSFLGLQELNQLLDYELSSNHCIENSEQHQTIWCIGRQTAVRPGSIGPSRHREDYLRWGDIEFRFGSKAGMIDCTINIRVLKTNYDDPEKSNEHQTMPCYLKCPLKENIIFSVAHRLLVIALRRKLLVGITSVDELLQSERQNIQVKPEHLSDPVFYGAKSRGLELDHSHALSAEAITEYLKRRGQNLGYASTLTFYSIRRRTATDLVRRIGMEKTREIMGHGPETSTLERYYLDQRSMIDLTAATLEEPVEPGGFSTRMALSHAPLAHGRLDEDRLNRTRGFALNMLVDRMAREDNDFPVQAPKKDLSNYFRRLRRIAYRACLEKEHSDLRSEMTTTEWNARVEIANASTFADTVIKRAKELQRGSAELEGSTDDNIDYDKPFDEIEPEHQQDLDDDSIPEDGSEVRLFIIDEEEVEVDPLDEELGIDLELSFQDIVKAFMDLLLSNTMSIRHEWKDQSGTCALCEEDETVDEAQKTKLWKSFAHLKRHMFGEFHSKFQIWIRRQQITKDESGAELFYCPYEHAEPRGWRDRKELIAHVKRSTEGSTTLNHDVQKTEDGWYGDDFYGEIVTKDKHHNRIERVKKRFAELGHEFNYEPELLAPLPHETRSGLVYGNFSTPGVPKQFQHLIKEISFEDLPNDNPGTPEHLKPYIRESPEEKLDDYLARPREIPEHFKGLLEFVENPMDKWDREDKERVQKRRKRSN